MNQNNIEYHIINMKIKKLNLFQKLIQIINHKIYHWKMNTNN